MSLLKSIFAQYPNSVTFCCAWNQVRNEVSTYDVVKREAGDNIASDALHVVESVVTLVLVLQVASIKVLLEIEANVRLRRVWARHFKLEA